MAWQRDRIKQIGSDRSASELVVRSPVFGHVIELSELGLVLRCNRTPFLRRRQDRFLACELRVEVAHVFHITLRAKNKLSLRITVN